MFHYLHSFKKCIYNKPSFFKKLIIFAFFSLLLVLSPFQGKIYGQTSYTWMGTLSSAWNDAGNWSPTTGFPVAGDNVTINATGVNQPVLNAGVNINSLTVSGGTLDLNTFTLTVSGTPNFSGGNVNNGTLSITSGGTCTFGATAFGAAVTGSAASVLFNGAIFNNTLTIDKTGAGNDAGTGNTTFGGTTTISNSGSGYLVFANITRDIFNGDVTFTNTGSSLIYAADNGTNTEFNGNVAVNSTAGLGVDFGQMAGTSTLADGKIISVGSLGFTTGDLHLRNFTQTGATAQTLTLTGTADVFYQTGTTFNGNLTSVSPGLRLDGATFNGVNNFTQNGSVNYASTGGNTFNGVTTITNSGSGYFLLANTTRDIFNGDVTFTNTGSSLIYTAHNGANTEFNGNIVVNSTAGTGVYFGQGTGFAALATGKTISVGATGFTAGSLVLRDFIQTGTIAQSLTLTGTATLYFQTGSTFNGNLSSVSSSLNLNGSTFNGVNNFTKTGSTNDVGAGGNTFNGITTITNSGSGYLVLGNINPDVFNADVTANNTGSYGIFFAHNSAGNQFNGTTTLNNSGTGSNSIIEAGYIAGGTATFAGNVFANNFGTATNNYIRFNFKGACTFNNNIIVNSTAQGNIYFAYPDATGTGTATLANTKTISVGATGFSAGNLSFTNFTQTGATAQSLALTGSSSLSFETGTTFNGDLATVSPGLFFDGARFNGTGNFTKNGSTNDAGRGGNTFNGVTTINNSGSGYLLLGNVNPDLFATDLTVNNTGTNIIYLAHNSVGNQFNGNTTLNNSGSGLSNFLYIANTAASSAIFTGTVTANNNGTGTNNQILLAYSGACTFNGNTVLNNSASGTYSYITVSEGTGSAATFNATITAINAGAAAYNLVRFHLNGTCAFNNNIIVNSTTAGNYGIYFGQSGYPGTGILADTKTITTGTTGFSAGDLRFNNFTQIGATPQSFTLTESGRLYFTTGTTFNGDLSAISPNVYLNGAVFNGITSIEKNGAINNPSSGGNIFNGVTTITCSGSGYFLLGNGNADVFNADITFTNSGSNFIYVSYNTATSTFNGNIIVNSTGSSLGVSIGSVSIATTLANTKTISVGGSGFLTGTLVLRNFTQLGTTAQSLTLTGTAILTINSSSVFNGNVSFAAPQLFLNGCTFNGTAILEKTGASNNTSTGGNIFNSATSIENSGSGIMYLANTTADDYNADVSFIRTGSGALNPAYNTNCTFSGNISTVGSTAVITFAAGANGKVTIDGSGTQNFNGDVAFPPTVGNCTMATSGTGTFNLNVNLTVNGILTFTNGKITTGSNKIIISSTGSVAGSGQSTGWVYGKLQKNFATGTNVSAPFELGDNTYYTPAAIAFASVTTAGNLTANVTNTDHLNLSTSGININKSVNRYFTFSNNGIAFTTASVTLNWVASDVDAGSATANFKVKSYNGTSWNTQTVASPLPTSIQATGVTSFSDFAIGELATETIWTGITSSDWNDPNNWNSGLPTSATSNIIPSGLTNYPVINAGTIAVKDVTIQTGAALTVNAAVFQVTGIISNSGTFTATNGSIEMNGTSAQNIAANTFASNTIKDLVITNAAGVSLAGTLNITNTISFGNINNSTFSSGGYLTLVSNAAGTARVADITNGGTNTGNNITGNVTVQRFIPAKRAFRFLTPAVSTSGSIRENWMENTNNPSTSVNNNPVPNFGTHISGSGGNDNGFDQTQTNNPSLFTFNNATQAWVAATNTGTALTAGTAYRIMVRGSRSTDLNTQTPPPSPTTLRATGTLVTGTVLMTKPGAGGTANMPELSAKTNGYSFIGNPYASPVNWLTLEKTDLSSSIYIFDPTIAGANGRGGYVSYNGSTGNSNPSSQVDNNIQSEQAFFVQTTGPNPSLTFREQYKTGINRAVFRTPNEMPHLTLQLLLPGQDSTGRSADGLAAYFSNDFDSSIGDEDSYKFTNEDENIAIVRNGKTLSIEGRKPVNGNDTLPLKIWQLTKTNYTFKFNLSNFDSAVESFLEDSYLHSSTKLNNNAQTMVPFSITTDPASAAPDRFRVVFAGSVTLALPSTGIKAFEKNKGIEVTWTAAESNIDRYEVEKSADAEQFVSAGSVKAKVNAASASAYSWFDANPVDGDNFYRVKSIDNSGRINYSEVVKVSIKGIDKSITVYPNPVHGNAINLFLKNIDKGNYKVSLVNSTGQTVYKGNMLHTGGSGRQVIKLNNILSKGSYELQVFSDDTFESIAILVQ